jgi:hypothetical protein
MLHFWIFHTQIEFIMNKAKDLNPPAPAAVPRPGKSDFRPN